MSPTATPSKKPEVLAPETAEATASQVLPALVRKGISKDNAERREAGRVHMSATMIHWLARNDWSHPTLVNLACWAMNEDAVMHTSQASHIRNGKTRMIGLKSLDAFGTINLAVWAYHNNKRLLKKLGVGQITAEIEAHIRDAEWIENPITGLPLDQGGWMCLYLGYIKIPNVVGGPKGDEQFALATARLGTYVQNAIAQSGKDFPAATSVFCEQLGVERGSRLIQVALGLQPYEATELQRDLREICDALSRLDGKKRTPETVIQQLVSLS